MKRNQIQSLLLFFISIFILLATSSAYAARGGNKGVSPVIDSVSIDSTNTADKCHDGTNDIACITVIIEGSGLRDIADPANDTPIVNLAGNATALPLAAGSTGDPTVPLPDEMVILELKPDPGDGTFRLDYSNAGGSTSLHITIGTQGPAGAQGPPGLQGPPGDSLLAGQECPAGTSLIGFETDGTLICTSPAIHVLSASGNDSPGCGEINSPCQSIGFGVNEAQNQGPNQVLVATGNYPESFSLVSGIDVLGGYSADFATRDLSIFRPIISGDNSTNKTVTAVNLSSPTQLDGFTITGPNRSATSSSNSYAVYVKDSASNLTISDNIISAGNGGDGTTGANGSAGAPSGNGAPVPAWNTSTSSTVGGGAGGSGGEFGGKGGNAPFPPSITPGTGAPGGGANGGAGGAAGAAGGWELDLFTGCDISSQPSSGASGVSGTHGAHGVAGIGGSSGGAIVGNEWVSSSGTNGQDGESGGGGGGGGAGGGISNNGAEVCLNVAAVAGPGGGAGGASGTAGAGGGSGGGSFGIFIINSSSPTVSNNTINRGIAGNGGNGGSGQIGASGGFGASGVSGTGSVTSGNGGNGGTGGNSGGGGGGTGGPSVGVLTDSTSSFSESGANIYSGGSAGNGGTGGSTPGNPDGGSGANGQLVDTLAL